MFYSDVILSKRGPLGKVWLAAHFERKLNKTAFLQTSIQNSVSAIVEPRAGPLALRLSGQLLLGVVRIYSRKAKYLLDDCTDALLKIKMAFRAGAVDMTSDQATVSANQITLPSAQTDINILLPDAGLENWDAELLRRSSTAARTPSKSRGRTSATPGSSGGRGGGHLARQADITLPQARYDDFIDDSGSLDLLSSGMGIGTGDFDPDGGLDLGLDLGGDTAPAPTGGRRDSQGRLLDANGDVVREDTSDLSSIGVGRDAAGEREQSLGSLFGRLGEDDAGAGMDFGGGHEPSLDLGLGLDDAAMPPPADASLSFDEMTPRTKEQVTAAAERRAADAAAKAAKEGRKQLIDRVTELDEGASQGTGTQGSALGKRNVDGIVLAADEAQQQYLPRSRAYAGLLDMYNDPSTLFSGGKDAHALNLLAGSDLGLAPELSSLFVVDLESHRAAKRARRLREMAEDDPSMEVGRRAPTAEEEGRFGFGAEGEDTTLGGLGGEGAGFDMPMMDDAPFGLDVTGDEASGLRRSERQKAQPATGADETLTGRPADVTAVGDLPPLSRLGTPSNLDDLDAADSLTPTSSKLLAAFEARPADAEAQTPLAAAAAAEEASSTRAATAQGWSKNTVRAQRVIRSQLERSAEGRERATLSVDEVSKNASRRAAAGFFFELLVLGTKDQVVLEQDEAYGDVRVRGKEGLWA
ncbi:hypothetical protein BDZ90DRAFT_228478 [Jaminaea rosea]|uniref:Rad21/Rec8-like protein N-terminal domain-containing protein n=1 Tax=Jaminaea rosea TaxID=1569628 RepID=A0A316UII4_9BASI|nr:hypothetical protein BDZ90DRAFT_228478 [Jaminaea rosea]PWN25076.1 hypothetical protein BDZ90DRAFT_228478 [Jaminaea rosea]